ncbi:MAG: TIGR02808 family protein [Psychromonas sp.]|nr:TIGR02808 family protein [Psychromonas sp.]
MSELEKIIWNVLGYSSMPVIFICGFIGVFVIAVGILKITGNKPVEK